MVQFTATIKQFATQGEKTGWTYIEIPSDIAQDLKPGNKKSFRVKGKLDNCAIKGIALLPMGGGSFIMALNSSIRKCIGKRKGAMLKLQLEVDTEGYKLNPDFVACLADDPPARAFFSKLPKSHQNYFSKWIETAKTEQTKTKRIAAAVNALSRKMGFGEMLRSQRQEK
jgi:uncharacterized protein DUF1905/bacteriocin resistance YdeI/OmpD-like protein